MNPIQFNNNHKLPKEALKPYKEHEPEGVTAIEFLKPYIVSTKTGQYQNEFINVINALKAMESYKQINQRDELIKFWDNCEIDRKTKEKIIDEYLQSKDK